MQAYVGITDLNWFNYLKRLVPQPEEVNFWRPSSKLQFKALRPGEIFLFNLHALFDQGYVTISPSLRFEVSRKIKEEFENGRDYYVLHGGSVRVPVNLASRPSREFLEWHNSNVYRG